MGDAKLDEILEPLLQILILIAVLVTVATISFFVISKFSQSRRDRAHIKISGSRRTKHTQVDLLGGSKVNGGNGSGPEASSPRSGGPDSTEKEGGRN
jgi:hypothetical protein